VLFVAALAQSWLVAGLSLLYVVPLFDRSLGCVVAAIGVPVALVMGLLALMEASGGDGRGGVAQPLMTIAVILLAAHASLIFGLRRQARWGRVLALAVTDEEEGRYEAACYHYAIALNAGASSSVCESRIIDLWREHGPFTFGGPGTHLLERYCSHSPACGEGYHVVTVAGILRIVERADSAAIG
jgi:hypothetical protein